jgi:hypothetical protein
MAAPGALTDQDVASVRDEAARDRPVTVWFTAAAVGVPVGGSARVVAVGDTDHGEFIQVRPAGSRDTMYCSPNELTRIRPARRPTARAAAAGKPAQPTAPPAAPGARRSVSQRVAAVNAPPSRAPAPQAAGGPAVPGKAGESVGVARPRRRVARSAAITVSLTATTDGEWTVEVLAGTKRVVTAMPVPVAAVAAAARSLPPAVAEAIESSLEGVRQRQRERVEQLRAELDAAQRLLDQLGV